MHGAVLAFGGHAPNNGCALSVSFGSTGYATALARVFQWVRYITMLRLSPLQFHGCLVNLDVSLLCAYISNDTYYYEHTKLHTSTSWILAANRWGQMHRKSITCYMASEKGNHCLCTAM